MSASVLASMIGVCVVGLLAGVSIYFSYRKAKKTGAPFREWIENWLADFSTEMAGAFLTAILFGLIVLFAGKTDADTELKTDLIQQLSSQVSGVPQRAVEQLRSHGWLTDGSLRDAVIRNSDLSHADFSGAELQRVLFSGVNLTGSLFRSAILQDASIILSNMEMVDLTSAHLTNAQLCLVNIEGVSFNSPEPINSFGPPPFRNGATILPDGSFWTPNYDMTQFPYRGNLTFTLTSDGVLTPTSTC